MLKFWTLLTTLPFLVAGCISDEETALDKIINHGAIYIGTSMSPTTYYKEDGKPQGFEYEMALAFANYLGVRLEVVIDDNPEKLFNLLQQHKIDLAIGTPVSKERQNAFDYGPAYQMVSQELVFKKGKARPRRLSDLEDKRLVVQKGSVQEEVLAKLKTDENQLIFETTTEFDKKQLTEQLINGEIDFTVLESNRLALSRRFEPKLSVGMTLTEPAPMAWAFNKYQDDTIKSVLLDFFSQLKKSGELNELVDRYYGHVQKFDYVDSVTFIRAYKKKLPRYRETFEQAGELVGMDWRLIAAIGYQESHWNPRARSPTGVRGIMMLTLDTMNDLGLASRLDPMQAIPGGARHFKKMHDRISDDIEEPDRTWIALAAYNVGYGHITDAMDITQRNEMNPNRWIDLADNLPLLARKKWYKTTKYGYARGWEPVTYVKNIRRYYEILVWLTQKGTDAEWGFDDASHHNKYKEPLEKSIFPFLNNF